MIFFLSQALTKQNCVLLLYESLKLILEPDKKKSMLVIQRGILINKKSHIGKKQLKKKRSQITVIIRMVNIRI